MLRTILLAILISFSGCSSGSSCLKTSDHVDFVVTKEAALSITRAALRGVLQLNRDVPDYEFEAIELNDRWELSSKLEPGYIGGTIFATICKHDGAIIKLEATQ